MKGFLSICLMTAGGWAGWAIGAPFSIFVAFLLGTIGSGAGLYLSNRITRSLLP